MELPTPASPPALSYKQARHNERWNGVEILLAAPFIVVSQQYIPVMITRFGGSALLLGAVTSGSALMLTLASALAPRYLARAGTYYRAMGVSLSIFRSVMAIIPLMLLLPAYRAEAAVLALVLLSFFSGLANMSLTSYLPKMTFPDRLSELVSRRWVLLGVGMTIFTPLIAWVLDHFAQPTNYIVACLIALVIGYAGVWAVLRIRPVPDGVLQKEAVKSGLRELLSHKPARLYLLLTLLVHLALNAPAPLITLHMVRGLGATDTEFGWFLAIFWAALTVTGLVTGRVIRRIGNRKAFSFSNLGLAMQVLVIALAPTLPVTWIGALVGGVASVFFQVSAYALIVEFAPRERYGAYLSVYSSLVNFCIFAAPLAMTALVDQAWISISGGLLVSVVLRALAGALGYVLIARKGAAQSLA